VYRLSWITTLQSPPLASYWMGAGRSVTRLYAVTLGTGIGTSCVIDGQTYRGAGGFHPEGGHQIIDPAGRYAIAERMDVGRALPRALLLPELLVWQW